MNQNAKSVSVLYFSNLICLGALLVIHVLSFFGIGLIGFVASLILGLATFALYTSAYSRQVDRLYPHLYYQERHPFRLFDMRNARYDRIGYEAFWRYRATASVTMPLAPRWLVRLPGVAFLLAIPYVFLQIYLLMAYPAEINVILSRLVPPWFSPLVLYSLPILYSWQREMETGSPT